MDLYESDRSGVTEATDSEQGSEPGSAPPEPRRRIWSPLLDTFFPRICRHCDAAVADRAERTDALGNVLCSACLDAMKVAPEICETCGAPRAGASPSCHRPCPGGAAFSHVDGVAWIWSYEGPTASAMTAMKFARLDFLCSALVEASGITATTVPDIDAVVPVPLYWLRRWSRGYDQGRLLADAVSRRIGKPMLGALRRRRRTAVQSTLNEAKRRQNLDGAFALRRPRRAADLEGRRFLLVDDVLTTGATLDAAAAPLKAAGARCVWALTVARTPQKRLERLQSDRRSAPKGMSKSSEDTT